MEVFNLLISICLILVSIIIFLFQIREGVFNKKGIITIGDIKLTIAGFFSFLGGLYLLIGGVWFKW
jgi:hypothetical protein